MSADFCVISWLLTAENDCDQGTCSSQIGFKTLKSDFTKEKLNVLIWLIGLQQNVSEGVITVDKYAQICLRHYHKYIKYFENK